jgi:hypothetical protein
MARTAAYLLAVPGVFRVVLEYTVGAPRSWRLDLDLMLTSVPITLLATVLGVSASIFGGKDSQRDGLKAVFIAGGTVVAFALIAAASQPL